MEMAGSGLRRHLSTEQRKHLFSLYKKVCVADSYRSIMEALSLVSVPLCLISPKNMKKFGAVP